MQRPSIEGAGYLQEPATRKKASWGLILIFVSIWFGVSVNSAISANLFPLILRRMTENAGVIGMVLALNPAFGFVAQPAIGLISDHIWTPLGRRAFFIIVAAPLVALCLILIPLAAVFWHLVVLIALFEFFHDVIVGSDHPLVADMIRPEQRTLVVAMMLVAGQIGAFVLLRWGMGHVIEHYSEEALMQIGALVQLVFVMAAAFFLKEKRLAKQERPKLTVARYVNDLWGDAMLRKFAIGNFFSSFFDFVILGFVPLYAVYQLGLSRSEFGEVWSMTNLIALLVAIPAALSIERFFSKQWTLVFSYVLKLTACGLGLFCDSLDDLALIAIVMGLGLIIRNVTYKPFFTEYFPADLVGQLSGAMNVFFAAGRTMAYVAGGWTIALFGNNYSVMWYLAGIAGCVATAIMIRIPDYRYQQRKQRR